MANGELYQQRRKRLANSFGNTLFIIPSGSESMRSHSVAHRFKSSSDFLYLTGLKDSQNMILIVAGERIHLLGQEATEDAKIWEGVGSLADSDKNALGSLKVESISRFNEIINDYTNKYDRIAFPVGRVANVDAELLSLIGYSRRYRSRSAPPSLCDSRSLVGLIRLVKDESEIVLLREASRLSSLVHSQIMSQVLVGRQETEVALEIESSFMKHGMIWTAYGTIVGAGTRSLTLHARPTQRQIRDGELVLIDAGGEWSGYCSDITRTLPAGRRFSAEQRQVYSAVLAAQKVAIKSVAPGVTLQQLDMEVRRNLAEGLSRIDVAMESSGEAMTKLMPHPTSHWIGLDVHDPAPYFDDSGHPIRLAAGMSFTVEPGLYFRDEESARKLFGIGVGIEDDVLVTEAGCEVLTDVPKEIDEVEEFRSRAIGAIV